MIRMMTTATAMMTLLKSIPIDDSDNDSDEKTSEKAEG